MVAVELGSWEAGLITILMYHNETFSLVYNFRGFLCPLSAEAHYYSMEATGRIWLRHSVLNFINEGLAYLTQTAGG